jgi:hypothetical protein
MFMIQEIGVAPVPGDGFYQEGKFGDECVPNLHYRTGLGVATTVPNIYLVHWTGQVHAFYLRA